MGPTKMSPWKDLNQWKSTVFPVVTEFAATEERQQVTSFMEPIQRVMHTLFFKTPVNTFNFTAYFDSFYPIVWVFTGIFGLITAPFLFLSTQ